MKIDKLDLLEIFVRVAETESLTKTADDLDVAPATISRKLTRLEALLGQSLVQRSTHTISLTDTGVRFLTDAQSLLRQWERLEHRYQGAQQAMAGPLKVVAPEGIGQTFLTEVAIDFQKSRPSVELTWILQNGSIDFAEVGCDLWLCMGDYGTGDLIERPLAIAKRSLVAAPELLEGVNLKGPASVEKLPCAALNTREGGVIALTSQSSHQTITIYPQVAFATNNFFSLHTALLSGVGFGVLPAWFVQEDLKSGRLVEIIPDWAAPSLTLSALSDASRYQNQRTETFLQILSSRLCEVSGLRLTTERTAISIA